MQLELARTVIPTNVGIQDAVGCDLRENWIPAFAGMTCFVLGIRMSDCVSHRKAFSHG
jgi:hypothetical protein